MNITEIFTTLPVTTSFIVLVASATIITLFSVLFLECVKFIINQKAWKTEIINSKIIVDKLKSVFCKKRCLQFIKYGELDYYIVPHKGKFIWRSDYTGLQLKDGYEKGYIKEAWLVSGDFSEYITKFDTEEDALCAAGDYVKTKDVLTLKFCANKLLAGIITLDALLFLFKIYPVQTIVITGIITLVYSIRWLSGKLAKNVEKTSNHEERITKLEEEK